MLVNFLQNSKFLLLIAIHSCHSIPQYHEDYCGRITPFQEPSLDLICSTAVSLQGSQFPHGLPMQICLSSKVLQLLLEGWLKSDPEGLMEEEPVPYRTRVNCVSVPVGRGTIRNGLYGLTMPTRSGDVSRLLFKADGILKGSSLITFILR